LIDHGLGRWGEFLEAELTEVKLVVMHVLTSGSIAWPSSWIRGRTAEPTLYPTADAVREAVGAAWMHDLVFYWREVPSIQFVTAHGSIVVTDLWGDSRYRTLRGVKARTALEIDAPLMRAASRVEMLCSRGSTSPVLVTQLGKEKIDPLRPRVPLRAWSSFAVWDGQDGQACHWALEVNDYERSPVREVLRAFQAANSMSGS